MGGGLMACWTWTGTTCIDYLRVVSWDAIGLSALFSDWTRSAPRTEDWEPVSAQPNLRGYAYRGGSGQLVLSTGDGVTVGSTVEGLVETYGSLLRFSYDECAFDLAGFQVVDPADDSASDGRNAGVNWGLWGELSDLPDSSGTVVISVGAGSLLGHC